MGPPAVLVVDRDDAPAVDDLVRKLVESGARVEHEHMSGYEDFITDGEENAAMPWPSLRRIEAWLDAKYEGTEDASLARIRSSER